MNTTRVVPRLELVEQHDQGAIRVRRCASIASGAGVLLGQVHVGGGGVRARAGPAGVAWSKGLVFHGRMIELVRIKGTTRLLNTSHSLNVKCKAVPFFGRRYCTPIRKSQNIPSHKLPITVPRVPFRRRGKGGKR